MNRHQKTRVVEDLRQSFAQSAASFIVEYQGLSVEKMQQLRKDLRKAGALLRVSKARLMKKAVHGLDTVEQLFPVLKGQIGLVFVPKEPSSVAKIICDFSSVDKQFKAVGGYIDRHRLEARDIEMLAQLPSREKLLSLLCGTLQAPTSQVVRVLHIMVVRLLWTLKQVASEKA